MDDKNMGKKGKGERGKRGWPLLCRLSFSPHFILGIIVPLLITAKAFSATFTDEAGRNLELPSTPKRMIATAPSVTEILFALGLGDRVVGVSSYCNYPAEALHKEKIGGYINPSLEKIVELRPDLVMGTADGDLKAFMNKVTGLGIPVYVANPKTVADVLHSIRKIGEVTGATDAAARLTSSMQKRIDTVKQKVAGRSPPRVLHILSYDPLISSAGGSFVDDLIRIAGGTNVAAQARGRHPRLSLEEVIARDPEVIILSGMLSQDPLREQREWWARWKKISAVGHGRVHVIDADLILRPSPRIVDGLEEMARVIHPEAFSTGSKGLRVQGTK
ncbi:MAG: cobalamin-binding protein [Deltaproteobacteria bacterium]|nr:cobalamin-binding protein [Deltaproteobacteria bacterium]